METFNNLSLEEIFFLKSDLNSLLNCHEVVFFFPKSCRLLVDFLVSIKKMKVQMQTLQLKSVSNMCLLKEKSFASAFISLD